MLLANVCSIVAQGIVVFFPSYDALELSVRSWRDDGTYARLQARKAVFREHRSGDAAGPSAEATLREYARCIPSDEQLAHVPKGGRDGALLLCVVGGKMSEGINFSDHLGRCVVMVGMPYPNRYSAELAEKMRYLDAQAAASGGSMPRGRDYYEGLCMKAVNQSIGPLSPSSPPLITVAAARASLTGRRRRPRHPPPQ